MQLKNSSKNEHIIGSLRKKGVSGTITNLFRRGLRNGRLTIPIMLKYVKRKFLLDENNLSWLQNWLDALSIELVKPDYYLEMADQTEQHILSIEDRLKLPIHAIVRDPYSTDLSKFLKGEMVKKYKPLAIHIVNNVIAEFNLYRLPNSIDHQDLVQAASIGILDAYDKYDSKKGASFATYAGIRIKGAILDDLRQCDIVSRGFRTKIRKAAASVRALERALERDASTEEKIGLLKSQVDDDDYEELLLFSGNSFYPTSIFSKINGSDGTLLIDMLEDTSNGVDLLMTMSLNQAIASLPSRKKEVVVKYYVDNMTLRQIGESMDFTESRASQVLSSSIQDMRDFLEIKVSKTANST
jgi:RNA polymerase sigma factor FliA